MDKQKKKLNLAVVFGGKSGEHEVSLSSAGSVMEALDKEKYNIIPIAITKKGNWLIGDKGGEYMKLNGGMAKEGGVSVEDSQKLVTVDEGEKSLMNYAEGGTGGKKIDLVLPILHGPFGEDGRLQGMFDMLGVPYVFSGVLAHALAMNKHKTKLIARSIGVNVAKDIKLTKGLDYDLDKLVSEFELPIVIKPVELGSSVGISLAKTKEELSDGIKKAFEHDENVLLEQYIKGRELTVTVVGRSEPEALPVIEIIPKTSEWFDYEAKYKPGATEEVCPAEIPDELRDRVQNLAKKVFREIDCQDLSRADFIWDEKKDQLYFLEINTIPGMTATSLAPQAAKAAGMNFTQFLDRLIEGAASAKK